MDKLDRAYEIRTTLSGPEIARLVKESSDESLIKLACGKSKRRITMTRDELENIQNVLASSPDVVTLVKRMQIIMNDILTKRQLPVPFSTLLGRVSTKMLLQLVKRFHVTYRMPSQREKLDTFAWLVLARENLVPILKKQMDNNWYLKQIGKGVNIERNSVSINQLADLIIDYSHQTFCSGR